MEKIRKHIYQINCPVFSEYENRIDGLTQSINSHGLISDKVKKAQELIDIISTLSMCPKYDEKNEECKSCHFILNLRREIAELIIEADESVY